MLNTACPAKIILTVQVEVSLISYLKSLLCVGTLSFIYLDHIVFEGLFYIGDLVVCFHIFHDQIYSCYTIHYQNSS